MIRDRLVAAVAGAVGALRDAAGPEDSLSAVEIPAVGMERPANKEHGDWSTNVALQLAKAAGKKPRDLATAIVEQLGDMPEVERIDIAGPGFINFMLRGSWLTGVVRDVQQAGPRWGRIHEPDAQRINVEFVSANPTGPLHVGHGRWAAVGDVLAAILDAAGHTVEREFYVNDYGRQMDLFGASIAARYLEVFDRPAEIPEGGYEGDYVRDIAHQIKQADGDRYLDMDDTERARAFGEIGRERMLAQQRDVLERFGVRFNTWFSEASLHESGAVQKAIERLREAGHVYEADGALWLRTTDFGDDKDRVIVRGAPGGGDGDVLRHGQPTYMAPDIAYYLDKKSRGFDRLLYLWGADHHGYVARMEAAIAALGDDPAEAEFLIGQMVNLRRSGEPAKMSKRTGEFVTFEELIDEVGVDAARYTMLRHSVDSEMEFDLDLVVRQSQDNPVFYVQYAHARIASVVRFAEERGIALKPVDDVDLELLREEAELDLLRGIAEWPEAIEVSSRLRASHKIPRYAEDLAARFHAFYRDCRVVTEDADLTQARLHLCVAARITLSNALGLLGVGAPERMDRAEEQPE